MTEAPQGLATLLSIKQIAFPGRGGGGYVTLGNTYLSYRQSKDTTSNATTTTTQRNLGHKHFSLWTAVLYTTIPNPHHHPKF